MLNLLKGKMAERGYSIQRLAEAAKLCALLDIEPVEMHKYFVREDE